MRRYDWDESMEIGAAAVARVRDFLHSEAASIHWHQTKSVTSVESNRAFQQREIDLLVIVRKEGSLETVSIEVKGDLNHHTGNFFIETVSDLDRQIPGAFYTTRAKWYFYLFNQTETRTPSRW